MVVVLVELTLFTHVLWFGTTGHERWFFKHWMAFILYEDAPRIYIKALIPSFISLPLLGLGLLPFLDPASVAAISALHADFSGPYEVSIFFKGLNQQSPFLFCH